ncbi:MAG: hypothetical protein PHW96_03105 [Candidatus Nanoarchaeia archaeon]|nr:hypothetical protein [Candidatus Nanoarchaeia archaeon]
MVKGRPVQSKVREKITSILHYYGEMYGYDIYKKYKEIFGKASLRLIYYHLDKGIKLNIYSKKKVETSQGSFSWGNTSERIYYSILDGTSVDTRHTIKIQNKNIK